MITQILGIITLGLSLLSPLTIQPIKENIQPNINISINQFPPSTTYVNDFTRNGFTGKRYQQIINNTYHYIYEFQNGISWSNIRMVMEYWYYSNSTMTSWGVPSSGTPTPSSYGYVISSNTGYYTQTFRILPPPDTIAPTLTLGSTIVYFNATDYPNGITQAQQQAIINSYASVQDNNAGAFWELSGNYTTVGSSTTQSVTYGVRAKDAAGNVSAYQNFTIVYDVVPPYIAGPSQVTYVIGTISDIATLISENYTITDDILLGGNNVIGTYNLNQVGTYFIDIRATDISGNATIKSIQINIIPPPDTTPPVITGPTTLTFEVGTFQLIEQILNTYYTITDDRVLSDWSIIGSYNLLQAGTYSIQLRAVDEAGNNTTLPITMTVTAPVVVDTTPPTINGTSPVTRELGIVNNNNQLLALFNYSDNVTLPSAIVTELIGNVNYSQVGTYNVSIRATDLAGNQANRSIQFIIAPTDITPPVISGPNSLFIQLGQYETISELIDDKYTITDNVELVGYTTSGTINFNELGTYDIVITAIDLRNNESEKFVRVTVRDNSVSQDYNPLTDLLSGLFGGMLSFIFTIGTINLLGFRLLDAMALIILGAIILFVYKAIKGGS